VKLSTVILPVERWPASSKKWLRAEALGFHAAYRHDHLSWLRLREDAFVDWAGRYRELGITEVVIHWPEPDSPFKADERIFEKIATEALSQL
jgi:hypothetical protein